MTSPVLAHYGGAPEALTIALPLAIFAGFMVLEKRARRREREAAEQDAALEQPADAAQDLGPDVDGRRS